MKEKKLFELAHSTKSFLSSGAPFFHATFLACVKQDVKHTKHIQQKIGRYLARQKVEIQEAKILQKTRDAGLPDP